MRKLAVVAFCFAVLAFAPSASSDQPSNDPLDASEIMRVVTAHRSEVRRCYTDALRQKPNLQGKVRVRVVIAPSGRVSSATDGGSDLPDLAVRKCVADALSKLVFRASSSETNVTVPFVFVPDVADAGAPVDAATRG